MKINLPEFARHHKETWIGIFALLSIFAIYFLLHTKYYVYYVDDTWFVSEAYHYVSTGKTEDVLFRTPDAPDRVLLFGKTFFYIYGRFFAAAGWTKSNAHILSSIFIWLSAGLWFLIARQLNFSGQLQKLFPLSILIFPAFFSAANIARPDALIFFLSTLTFLLFLKRLYFLSGFALLISLECHLMGMTGFFYILSYVIFERKTFLSNKQKLIGSIAFFLTGTALGAFYYYSLHKVDFSFEKLRTVLSLKKEMSDFKFGFIIRYFVRDFWYRHVWELLLIITSAGLFIKNRLWRYQPFVTVFLPVMIVSSFVASRPNPNYMLFVYPAFLLLIFYTFEKLQMIHKLLWCAGSALVVLYGCHYLFNRSFDFQAVVTETRKNLPDENLPVIGMPDNWFAVPERVFYPIHSSVKQLPSLGLKEFYLVRNDYIKNRIRNYNSLIAYFQETYDFSLTSRFKAYNHGDVEIYHCRLKHSNPKTAFD